MSQESLKAGRMQRMRGDIGAEGQETLQNQLSASVLLPGWVSHPLLCNPDPCMLQCAFLRDLKVCHRLCGSAHVCVLSTVGCAQRAVLVRARSGNLIGAAAAAMFPAFQ